jgi:DHA1 family multidrug resistance protein-like MFS transporter
MPMNKKPLPLFFLAIFMLSTGFGIMTPAVPLFAGIRFMANEWELGILGALAALPYVFAPAIFGKLSDRVGRRPVMVSGLCIYFAASLCYFVSSGLSQLAVLRILEGVSFSMIWPSAEAFVGDNAPGASRSAAVGLYSVSWSAGYMVGPFIMGILVSFTDITYSFVCTALFMAISIIILLRVRGAGVSHKEDQVTETASTMGMPIIIYTMILWGFSALSFYFLFPAYASMNDISPSYIGYLVGLAGLLRTAVFLFYYRLVGFLKATMLPIGMLFLSLSMFAFWAASSLYGFAISVILLGLSLGFLYAYSLVYMLNKPAKGLYAGLFESSIGTGELIGPLAMGYIGFSIAPSFPFLILGIVGTLSILVTFRFIRIFYRRGP